MFIIFHKIKNIGPTDSHKLKLLRHTDVVLKVTEAGHIVSDTTFRINMAKKDTYILHKCS